jgi:flagellar basal body rod protein FlgF
LPTFWTKATAEKYQETGNILDAVGAGVEDAALTVAGGKLVKVGRKLAAPRAATPKLAFETEVSAFENVNTSAANKQIGKIKKEDFGGGEMRTDGKDLYRFDRAHQTGKIHLEKYVKTGKGWQSYAECDPNTLKEIPGSVEKIAKQKRKPIK